MKSRYACLLVAVVIVALLFGCAPQMTRDEVIQQQASSIMAPKKPLSQYADFKWAGMEMDDMVTQDAGKAKAAQELENKLHARISPLLSVWTGKKTLPDAKGTLIIKPVLHSLRIISGGVRFMIGALAGDSKIDMDLLLIEESSNQTVGIARIEKVANPYGGLYSMGASDEDLPDYIVDVAYQYLTQNHSFSKPPVSQNMPLAENQLPEETRPASQNMPLAEKQLPEKKTPITVEHPGSVVEKQERENKQPQESAARFKLALLPCKISTGSGIYSPDEFYLSIAFDALGDVIKKTKQFALLFSYYPYGQAPHAKPIDNTIFRGETKTNIWKRKGFFPNIEPDTQILADIGRRLNVDAVLVYYIMIDRGEDDLAAFLVDVNNNRIYSSTGDCIDYKAGEGYDAIYEMTKKVFNDLAASGPAT